MSNTVPFPSESAIEDFIYNEIVENGHCPITGENFDHMYRQPNLGSYGIADIVKIIETEPSHFCVTVLELKNEPLNGKHLSQLARYMVGLDRLLTRFSRHLKFTFTLRGELGGVGHSADFVFLLDYIKDNITVFDISLSMKSGFKSKLIDSGWYKVNEKPSDISFFVRDVIEARVI